MLVLSMHFDTFFYQTVKLGFQVSDMNLKRNSLKLEFCLMNYDCREMKFRSSPPLHNSDTTYILKETTSSANNTACYSEFGETSAATALVSGTIALALQAR